jgi:glutathione S-transferase
MAHTHHSWLVSPYSAKTRSYLRYRRVDFDDDVPSVVGLYGTIQRAVGRMVMPTVHLEDGTWLQDSSSIIDHFEADGSLVTPTDPSAALASSLLEVFADEWLPMAALHYRWDIEENAAFALDEFARCGMPWLPRPLGRRLIRPMARRMAGYLPVLGVTAETIPALERTVEVTIAAMEATLATRPYLLGGRPSLGDFALYGPLWAHLYRDPGSRYLFDAAPAVVRWMRRFTDADHQQGAFEPGVPETLDPLFEHLVTDQLAWNRTLVAAIDTWCSANPGAHRVPRALGTVPFSIGGSAGERKLITSVQWKAQRSRAAYDAAVGAADGWLSGFSDRPPYEIIPTVRNPFMRVGFKEVLVPRG